MSADPDAVRAEIEALLAELPDLQSAGIHGDGGDIDLDAVASCLEAAHDVLVRALESVEKG